MQLQAVGWFIRFVILGLGASLEEVSFLLLGTAVLSIRGTHIQRTFRFQCLIFFKLLDVSHSVPLVLKEILGVHPT